YLSGYDVTLDEAAADTDGDGEVTMFDSSLLSQYLSGYDVTMGPDESVEQGPVFNDGELTIW
ncbi:MAG: hypothetical protein IKA50_06410, partial [Clostridia bacterium]|nr:hypothetical protein [Clostridia bacterium]